MDRLLKVTDNPNISSTEGGTALMFASINGQFKVVERLLLDQRVKVDQERNSDGRTALIFASAEGYTEIVEALLKKGANPNKRDKRELSAIDYATRFGHKECLEILRKNTNVIDTLIAS